MISAFRMYNRISCINHLLNNVVEKSIKDTVEAEKLCEKCKKLVKYFKKSELNSALHTTLKSFCPTRWNTIYYVLKSVGKNWLEINTLLQEKNDIHRIRDINLNSINAIVSILSHFEEASKKLEGEEYPTLHWVYIYVHRLKKVCLINENDIDIIKVFKEKLNYYLNEIVEKNLTIYHKISIFLFPPTNKLKQFSETEIMEIKTECKLLMRDYGEYVAETENEVPSTSNISAKNSELLQDFMEEAIFSNNNDAIEYEMRLYENTNVEFYDEFNVLKWWNSHKAEYPKLFRVSCRVLSTPASSAASERTFSYARNLITEKRSLIASNPYAVNRQMFIHSNLTYIDVYEEIEKVV